MNSTLLHQAEDCCQGNHFVLPHDIGTPSIPFGLTTYNLVELRISGVYTSSTYTAISIIPKIILILILFLPISLFAAQANNGQNPGDGTAESETATPADVSPAESGNPLPARDDQWRFTIAFPMIWAPDINGKIRGDEPIDFTINFKDILDNLSFGIMFELYANRGPYGLAFRSSYLRVEDENSRSGLFETRIRTGLNMGVNDLLASFRVHDKVRLVTGVRHILAKMELDVYSTLGGQEVFQRQIVIIDDNKFDLLIGINFNHWFNHRWGLMLNADLGVAGDNDRDFSTEFRAIYRLSDLNNIWFGVRFLNIGNDTTVDGITYKVDMQQLGPTLGWAFTF